MIDMGDNGDISDVFHVGNCVSGFGLVVQKGRKYGADIPNVNFDG